MLVIKLKTWINLIIFNINTMDSQSLFWNVLLCVEKYHCSLNLVPPTCLLVKPLTCRLVEPHKAWCRASVLLTLVKVPPNLQHGQPSHSSLYSLVDYLPNENITTYCTCIMKIIIDHVQMLDKHFMMSSCEKWNPYYVFKLISSTYS